MYYRRAMPLLYNCWQQMKSILVVRFAASCFIFQFYAALFTALLSFASSCFIACNAMLAMFMTIVHI
jgi:hypothetical protein